jgi:hypothetical protein
VIVRVEGQVVGVGGREVVRCAEAKVSSLSAGWEEARGGPAGREVIHAEEPDGLVDAGVEVVLVG